MVSTSQTIRQIGHPMSKLPLIVPTTNAETAETIGHVALNVLTNYFNKAADVAIDFPVVTV
jgi:hypothetical protein